MAKPLWKSLAISWNTRYATTIWPRNCTPRHLSQRDKNLWSHKNLHVNSSRSLIHNSQRMETTQMSFNVWASGVASKAWRHKRSDMTAASCIHIQRTEECKKPIPKGYIPYDSLYATRFICQIHRNGEQISGCHELRRWRQEERMCGYKKARRGILVMRKIFCFLAVINASTWLWYHTLVSAKCYHLRKLGKGTLASLCTICCNCIWQIYMYNYWNKSQ